eukprot:gene22936-biopygen1219
MRRRRSRFWRRRRQKLRRCATNHPDKCDGAGLIGSWLGADVVPVPALVGWFWLFGCVGDDSELVRYWLRMCSVVVQSWFIKGSELAPHWFGAGPVAELGRSWFGTGSELVLSWLRADLGLVRNWAFWLRFARLRVRGTKSPRLDIPQLSHTDTHLQPLPAPCHPAASRHNKKKGRRKAAAAAALRVGDDLRCACARVRAPRGTTTTESGVHVATLCRARAAFFPWPPEPKVTR